MGEPPTSQRIDGSDAAQADRGGIAVVNEGGTVITTGYTVDAIAGQQGITFAAAANGARNYVVVFRAR